MNVLCCEISNNVHMHIECVTVPISGHVSSVDFQVIRIF